jgi:hypothetical protein
VTQLSFFAADEHDPEPSDLEGALAARGQTTLTGALAQVSVVLDAAWRADALMGLLSDAGLDPVRSAAGPDGRCTVSTARTAVLVPVARRWRRGAVTAVPEGWTPSAGALRVWFLTAGRIAPGGAIDLGIDAGAEQHAPRRAALVEALGRAGIRATYVGPRGDGPLLRLGTARARTRLAEMLGAAPPGVPTAEWPV